MKRIQHGKQTRRMLLGAKTTRARRGLAMTGLLGLGVLPALFAAGSAAAPAPVGQGFSVTPSDISHILRQIKIAEAHTAKNNEPGWLATHGICDALVGFGPDQISSPLVADGLRTVDGSCNNLIQGQEKFGAGGQIFPRLTTPQFRDAEASPPDFFGPGSGTIPSSSYTQKKGFVFDSQPRLISNLIVDQTATNPAAVSAAGRPVRTQGNEGVFSCVATNEVQTLSGTPSADFSLVFEGLTTASLAPTATAADVRAALVALANVGPADVGVTGGALPDPITITFRSALKARNVAQITVVPGTSAISGVTVVATPEGSNVDPLADEVQEITGTPSAAFSIEFAGLTTGTLAPTASASEIEGALAALTNIGAGNVAVTGSPGAITVTFQGSLAATNVAELMIVPGTSDITNLTPATPTEGASGDVGCVPEHETLFIPNVTTDVGLSPPFNALFTIFGQFFDHGVDQTVKGGGTVFVPLSDDDPLIAGPDHILLDDPSTEANEAADNLPPHLRFMVLTRGANQPGPDGILGDNPGTPADESADDIQDANNTDTPFVDQSQTYTSHSSHQVFVRDYVLNAANKPVTTGKLLHSADGGMGTWFLLKKQAAEKLGFALRDKDALDIPMVAADLYGNFIAGPNGLPQYVTDSGLVEGNLTTPVAPPADVKHFDIPFLTDIAHSAVPDKFAPSPGAPKIDKTADTDTTAGGSLDPVAPGEYDNELLDLHFIAGDGRVNENIALTAVHQIFHSEHDRLVDEVKHTLLKAGDLTALNQWLVNPIATIPTLPADIEDLVNDLTAWRGERLFQAARFVTEMEYQHLVFEEFGRKIQPLINPFAGFAFTQTDINPAVKAEFAHAVYRFGHSMLTETINRKNEDGSTNDIKLLDGFLNPAAYTQGGTAGTLNSQQAAGSILMGLSDDTGNEIDEFVTDTLRNNLLGLPLDLPTINLTRARSEGIPPLNELRRQLYNATQDSQLQPYTDWIDFGLHLKHPESLINFVAAYGKHPSITGATTLAAKREAARLIVDPGVTDTPPADAGEFLNSIGAWANQPTGLNDVDLWVGGLAERTNLFGGLLGSTFNYVFESQLTDLQNSDRLYYLGRTPGMNLRAQLEGNSFAELVMRNTTAHTLKADAFATADCKFELGSNPGIANVPVPFSNLVQDDPNSDCDESKVLIRMADGTIRYRTTNTVDPPGINGQAVYNGTAGPDKIFGGVDNDTFLGNEGDDIIEGSDGADVVLGGEGNDRITDNAGDDVLKGGPGNDAIEAGPGLDIIMGGAGKDFMNGGANINEIFGAEGDDFMILGQGEDAGFGDSGDDWIEGGDQPDLMQGDSGSLFFDDRNAPGHDIFIGQAGDDDYDAEGGDDIMVTGPGIEKNAGAAGFDWSTGFMDTQPQDADLNLRILPPSVIAVDLRDRFNETEALSGGPFDDKLRGDDLAPSTLGGGGFLGCDVLDQASLDRISGLDPIVPPLTEASGPIIANAQTNACNISGPIWGDGNILLGGGGSDLLEGRGANDILDGDRYLRVRLSVRDHNLPAVEIGSADLMESQYLRNAQGNLTGPTLQQAVFAGTVDPGDIVAVREILTPAPGTAIDTAVFSDALANYTITSNPDGSTTVSHQAGAGADGIDTLWNMERLQFTDQTIPVAGAVTPANTPATGTPAITGTAQAGAALTATNGTVADVDGIASVSFAWEVEVTLGIFVQVGAGPSFTPSNAHVGRRLRVVATVLDNLGATTPLTSAPTAPVAPAPVVGVNVAATGAPIITDAVAAVALAGRPRVNEPLGTDTTGISDANGIVGAVFTYQWQRSTDGVTFSDIAGATNRTFTPTTAQLGDLLRVRVSFTDQGGFAEALASAATRDVRPARGRGGRPPVLVLNAVAVPRTVTVSLVARRGLPVSFTAPVSTTVVRVMVFRVGSKRPLATQFIRVKLGKTTVKLNTAAMKRALRLRGRYRIEVTPGRSRAAFGKATVRLVTVRR